MGYVNFMFSKCLENTYLRATFHILWSWRVCMISLGKFFSDTSDTLVDYFWFKFGHIWKSYEVGSLRTSCLRKVIRNEMDDENERTGASTLHTRMHTYTHAHTHIHRHAKTLSHTCSHTHMLIHAILVQRKLKFLFREDYFKMWKKLIV